MFQIRNCNMTKEQMELWVNEFIPEQEPYFLIDEEIHSTLRKQGIEIYSRNEFFDNFSDFIITYGSMYHVWSIPHNSSVIFVGHEELNLISQNIKQRLMQQQAELKRGQIYSLSWIENLDHNLLECFSEECRIVINNENNIILNKETWYRLTINIRQRWIMEWLSERLALEGDGVLSHPLLDIPEKSQYIIKKYKCTFPNVNGANCFASSVAVAIGDERKIIEWMNVEQFLQCLNDAGYSNNRKLTFKDKNSQIKPCDVLVWVNNSGDYIHSAYALSQTHVFNKVGQFWHQPWQILSIEHVFNYADSLSNGGHIAIYRNKNNIQ